MTRHGTHRLLAAAVVTALGALVALLTGTVEAAALAAPWAALLTLGFASAPRAPITASAQPTVERTIVGDRIGVAVGVTGANGRLTAQPLPGTGFRSNRPACAALTDEVGGVTAWMTAAQWGTHDAGLTDVEVVEPYGLFRTTGTVGQSRPIRIHPSPDTLERLVAPHLVRTTAGVHAARTAGRGVEYADIRPYSPGDALRDINWRASARSTHLWVSQRHPDRSSDVVLLVDSFLESGHDATAVVGMAVEASIALAEQHLAATDRVGLVDMGGVVRWVAPGTGRAHLHRLVDALLSTSLIANAAYRELDIVPPRALPPRSFVVALTPLLDDRFIAGVAALGTRGHDVMVIECGVAASRSTTALTGVAQRLWDADRQMVRDRLAERGISVARWNPGEHLGFTLRELERSRTRQRRPGR